MDAFTADELNVLRSEPQSFVPKLSVYKAASTWRGRLNGAHDKGARTLSILTEDGDTADILEDSTLLVGEGVNQHRLRIRDASGTFLYMEENTEDWSSGTFLNALLYIEPFAVFARDVRSGDLSVTHYEDYDEAYTNQNSVYDPVMNIGPAAFALEIDCDTSGSFTELQLSASGSFVYGSSILSYLWGVYTGDQDPYDAEIIGSPSGSEVTFRFWDDGDYYIWCRGTSANGKQKTVYRPVIVRCDEPGHPNSPFYNFEVEGLDGSRDEGYWNVKISLFEDCDEEKFPRNMPIVLYGSVVYGKGSDRTTTPIAWHYESGKHQKFVGWVKQETWIQEYKDKGEPIMFEATGVGGILETLENYPLWLQYSTLPTEWSEITNLTTDKAVYFYLSRRSTLLSIVDWHPTNDPRLMQYANIPNGSMLSGLRDFLYGTIFAEIVSDRQSALWTEMQAQLLVDSARPAYVTGVLTSTVDDHLNEVTIPTTRDQPEISWLSIDGVHYDGSTNTPLISWAPGYAIKSKGGSPEEMSGLVLNNNQADLNIMSGRLFAMKNNPFKDVDYTSKGNYPYDIAPQATISYSELQSGTFRDETITLEDYLIRDISDDYNPKKGNIFSKLKLEAVIKDINTLVGPNVPKAGLGVTGLFPPVVTGVDPDDFNINWPDFSFDWLDFEDLLPEDLDIPQIPFIDSPAYYLVYSDATRLVRSRDFGSGVETWEQLLTLASFPAGAARLEFLTLDSYDPKNIAYLVGTKGSTTQVLWQIDNLNGSAGQQVVSELYQSAGVTGVGEWRVHSSINTPGFLWFKYGKAGKIYFTRRASEGGSFSAEAILHAATDTNDYFPSAMGNHWASASSGRMLSANRGGAEGASIYESTDGGQNFSLIWNEPVGPPFVHALHIPYDNNPDDKLFFFGTSDGFLIRRELDGVTFTSMDPSGSGEEPRAIHTYTGDRNYVAIITRDNTNGGHIRLSADGGNTWSLVNSPVEGTGNETALNNALLGWPYDPNIMVVDVVSGALRGIWWTADLFSGAPNPTWYNAKGNIESIAGYVGIWDAVPVWVE